MPAPLSLDIRRRFERYILDGFSGREAARRLMISSATGARLAVKVKRGESLAPAKCGRPLGWGVMGAHRAFLIELVEQDPDISLMELRDALADAEGVEVHYSTISYALRRFGFTYKTYGPPLLQEDFEVASDGSAQTYPVSRFMTVAKMELRAVRSS